MIIQKHRFLFIALFILVGTFTPAPESAPLSEIIDSSVEIVVSGFQFTEGPVWHKDGYLLFSDIPAANIIRCVGKGNSQIWRVESGGSNGLTFDLKGHLIACEHVNRRVTRTESNGAITILADQYEGKRLNSPNDAAVRSDGMIFFTDPTYGISDDQKELSFCGVYRVTPGNAPVLLADDLEMPNGLAFSPDESRLYIADSKAGIIRLFNVKKDGTLEGGKTIARMGTPDGMKVDSKGRIFATAEEGVIIYDPDGERIAIIEVPEQPANCAFGGKDSKTLYITARQSLYQVRLKDPGISVWR